MAGAEKAWNMPAEDITASLQPSGEAVATGDMMVVGDAEDYEGWVLDVDSSDEGEDVEDEDENDDEDIKD